MHINAVGFSENEFEQVTDHWGLGYASFSSGAAYADMDNDGDLDIVVNNISDKAFIFENVSTNRNYLKVNLEGSKQNINGLGTKGVTLAPFFANQMVNNLKNCSNIDKEVNISRYYSLYYEAVCL